MSNGGGIEGREESSDCGIGILSLRGEHLSCASAPSQKLAVQEYDVHRHTYSMCVFNMCTQYYTDTLLEKRIYFLVEHKLFSQFVLIHFTVFFLNPIILKLEDVCFRNYRNYNPM